MAVTFDDENLFSVALIGASSRAGTQSSPSVHRGNGALQNQQPSVLRSSNRFPRWRSQQAIIKGFDI
jgi:hypothetical protein